MKKTKRKNIERYKKEFQDIPIDQVDRIYEYMESRKFNKKNIEHLYSRIKDISGIKEKYIKIVFYIIPEATPRPRMGIGHFYVKNAKSNNDFVKLMVKNKKDLYHFITTPCEFIVKNYFPIPKSFNKTDTLLAEMGLIDVITRPDWDNLGKTYSDMVQKYILADDSLITIGSSYKFYSLKPRVEIFIKYKENHSCKHNKKLIEKYISGYS